MTTIEAAYAFPNAGAVQRERLRALEALLDEGTIHLLDRRGVSQGWRCLEVGAGGGSIASWLCTRVAPGGSVVATDLDTKYLEELVHPNLELRVHDVLKDELPEGGFDLVHLRLVLAWLEAPHLAVRRLVAALKPGGYLVAEEMDFQSVAADPRLDERTRALFSRVVEAHHAVLSSRHSFDPFYGRRVIGDLTEAGLEEIQTEGRAAMWRGGEPGGTVWRLTLAQLREAMIASGLVTADEINEVIEACEDSRLSLLSPVTMAAWGRRPAGFERKERSSCP